MGNLTFFNASGLTLTQIVFNILLTFVLVLLISWIYKRTHRGLSYSQSFIFTLILSSLVVCLILMIIGNNIALAFGAVGAFSIIRFRTAIKDTKDTVYIFFALGIGMAVGTRNYLLAVVTTLLLILIIWFINKINFGSLRKYEYLLSFVINYSDNKAISFEEVFAKHLKSSSLLNMNTKKDGQAIEMTYSINFLDENKREDLVRAIAALPGMEKVHLITSREDIEY